MRILKMFIISLLVMTQLEANNSVGSEMSHVIGGVVMAAGITAVVDQYYPEYQKERGMIGFGVSSAVIVLEQAVEVALHGDASGQALDALAHIAGSALGAYVTDEYVLSPIISHSAIEGNIIGLNFQASF